MVWFRENAAGEDVFSPKLRSGRWLATRPKGTSSSRGMKRVSNLRFETHHGDMHPNCTKIIGAFVSLIYVGVGRLPCKT